MKRPKRRETNALLLQLHEQLAELTPAQRRQVKKRAEHLAGFEGDVLERRIFNVNSISRTQLAVELQIGQSQAEQLERRMVIRVLAIIANRKEKT